jgi:hypothetical protein
LYWEDIATDLTDSQINNRLNVALDIIPRSNRARNTARDTLFDPREDFEGIEPEISKIRDLNLRLQTQHLANALVHGDANHTFIYFLHCSTELSTGITEEDEIDARYPYIS